MIFQYFDGNDIVGATFPALDHLPKCSTTQKLEHLQQKNDGENQLVSVLFYFLLIFLHRRQRIEVPKVNQLILNNKNSIYLRFACFHWAHQGIASNSIEFKIQFGVFANDIAKFNTHP